MIKKITSFTAHVTGEGQRITFTYSVIDEDGNLISQNNRESFIVVDDQLQDHIDAINEYIKHNKF